MSVHQWGPQRPLRTNWPQSRLATYVPPRKRRPTNVDEAKEMWDRIPQWADEQDPGVPGQYKTPPRPPQNRDKWTNPLVGELVSEGHGFVRFRVSTAEPIQVQVWRRDGVIVRAVAPPGMSDEQLHEGGIPRTAEIIRPSPRVLPPEHRAWMLGGTAFYRDAWTRRGCPRDPVERQAWYAGFLEEAAGIGMGVYTVAEAISRIEAHGVVEDAEERPIAEAVEWVKAGIKPKGGRPRKRGRPTKEAARKRKARAGRDPSK
jgi:hypothetical protein